MKNCPTGAMWHPKDGLERCFENFAVATKSVISFFPKDRIMYLTVMKNMTKACDCSHAPGNPMCRDLGYLMEDSPLKIDQEAVELITKQNPKALKMETWKLFENQAKKHF